MTRSIRNRRQQEMGAHRIWNPCCWGCLASFTHPDLNAIKKQKIYQLVKKKNIFVNVAYVYKTLLCYITFFKSQKMWLCLPCNRLIKTPCCLLQHAQPVLINLVMAGNSLVHFMSEHWLISNGRSVCLPVYLNRYIAILRRTCSPLLPYIVSMVLSALHVVQTVTPPPHFVRHDPRRDSVADARRPSFAAIATQREDKTYQHS